MQKIHRIWLLSVLKEMQVCPWISLAPKKQYNKYEIQNKGMCDFY